MYSIDVGGKDILPSKKELAKEKLEMEKKVTYKIENGKKVKVETFANGNVYKYDTNGRLLHYKHSDGYEKRYEYDANGNMVHYKDSDGYEKWKEYDSNGNEIHYKDNDGYEKWCKYDSNGNMIHYKDNEGFEQWL